MHVIQSQSGFTLLELLVTIGIVGVLAAVAIPQFSEYRTRGKISAAARELSDLRTAFYAYIADNEDLPADTGGGEIPVGMEALISNELFTQPTPLGGVYNWDGLPNHDPPGISIDGPTESADTLLQLDRYLDDGDLTTGQFVLTHDGHYKLIIEM